MKPRVGSLNPHLASIIILLAGTGLRLFRLGADSLWYDETVSTYLAGSALPELLRHTAGDIHPPGYYVLLRAWLILMGYPTGRADPDGIGLEFAAGFFSLFFGVLLIALVCALGRRTAGQGVALVAAALVAVSPFNVWYSQEVRMYTVGAALAMLVLYILLRATGFRGRISLDRNRLAQESGQPESPASRGPAASRNGQPQSRRALAWWAAYALAAAAGMYTLYYFAFLLLPLNVWALARLVEQRRHEDPLRGNGRRSTQGILAWAAANLAILLLYAPWIPVGLRQATDPPVEPWRIATPLGRALREAWNALSLGQSAPFWLWPILLLTLALYVLGLFALSSRRSPAASRASRTRSVGQPPAVSHMLSAICHPLFLATFGPLGLLLLISALVAPLYHVRYLFTYSAPFYVVEAAGITWCWRRWKAVAVLISLVWLAAAGMALRAFWYDPAYRADDHRSAVRFLQSRWRPGDLVLVNAGYTYPPLLTYWQGPVASRTRLAEELPVPRADAGLVAVTGGHVDGDPGLGWGDPQSDFFAASSAQTRDQITRLFERFPRVWHYRIYDTVTDPDGLLRGSLIENGQPVEDRAFPGEAQMRVQGFVPQGRAAWLEGRATARYDAGLSVQWDPLPAQISAGDTIYPRLTWRAETQSPRDVATSLRLVGPDCEIWAQPPDERPLGPLFPSSQWPSGDAERQPLSMKVPLGTPPGEYEVELVVYDPATGKPWPPQLSAEPRSLCDDVALASAPPSASLGTVTVLRPSIPPKARSALARFGPLALVGADSPASVLSPGDQLPVELLWQAGDAPGEPLVVVVQLLDRNGSVAAGLEEEPLRGRYPTQDWQKGDLVRDRHTLGLPPDVQPGDYRLIVGVYRAADRTRLPALQGLFSDAGHYVIKPITVRD